MIVEHCFATCSDCDWIENDVNADVHAESHSKSTGHHVRVGVIAHTGPARVRAPHVMAAH